MFQALNLAKFWKLRHIKTHHLALLHSLWTVLYGTRSPWWASQVFCWYRQCYGDPLTPTHTRASRRSLFRRAVAKKRGMEALLVFTEVTKLPPWRQVPIYTPTYDY